MSESKVYPFWIHSVYALYPQYSIDKRNIYYYGRSYNLLRSLSSKPEIKNTLMNDDLIMFLECQGRTAAVKGILRALSADPLAVWSGS